MKKICVITTCAILALLSAGVSINAQRAKSVSEKSYEHARRVLNPGMQALGGTETFRRTEGISVKYTGKAFEQGQSANPEAPYYVRQEEGMRIIDIRGKRSSFESKTNYRGGDPYWRRQVLNDKSGFTLDLTTNVAYPIASETIHKGLRDSYSCQKIVAKYSSITGKHCH